MQTLTEEKWLPKIGDTFRDKYELMDMLARLGWESEGCSTSISSSGRATGYDVGVTDKSRDLWIIVDLIPCKGKRGKIVVQRIKELKLSDYASGKKS